MSGLHLAVLGAPRVRHGTHHVSFRTRKALALLIYLAVEGEAHTREKLATLFWPDSDDSAARANLRSTLMYLRKALAHKGGQGAEHLVVERQRLRFNRDEGYSLDVKIVGEALAEDDAQAMERALEQVRGEFLEGFSLPDAPEFDNWATLQREAAHVQINRLFARLSKAQLDAGQAARAQQTARQWLAHSPLEERAYRRSMQAQAAAGNRAGALRTYEKCCRQLRQELDVEPAPKTSALAERIKTLGLQDFALATEEAGEATFSAKSLPLVGRAEEHRLLVEAFGRAKKGSLQVVMLEGEAGIGKTRLAHTFLAWARGQGARTLEGRAYETGGRLPYQPIVDLWRSQLETESADGDETDPLDQLSDTWLAELSTLFPSLHNRYPHLTQSEGGEPTSANRLFEALSRLGQLVSRARPLVLFIDDLQWADVASLDLLHYVARRWQEMESRVLLLLSVRNEALVARSTIVAGRDLSQWLQSIERDVMLTRLPLAALDDEDVQQLIRSLVNTDEAHALAGWLYEETIGQPFYLVETLTALMEMGDIAVERAPDDGWQLQIKSFPGKRGKHSFVPPGVRELIRNRLSRLSPPAFELLAAAAVLGHEFTFRHLYRLAALEPAHSIRAMDELVAARFLLSRDGPSPYHFSHDKIRDVVYTEAGDARRHIFHQRAFQLLQAEDAAAARVAHHALEAGETQAAFDYYLQAGADAMALFAVQDAAHFYEQARQILVETEAVDVLPQNRRRLYERLARAYELLNRWDDAETIYKEMLAFARANALPTWTATALNRLALVNVLGYWQPAKATTVLEEARLLEGGRANLIETECILSQIRQYEFDQEAAMAHAQRAVSLARKHNDEQLLARSLNTRAYAQFGISEALPRIEADAREATELYARQGNRALQADSLAMVGQAQRHQGRVQQSVDTMKQARTITLDIDNSWGQINTSSHLAEGLLELGQYGKALEMIEAGIATARAHEHTALLANTFSVRGTIYRAMRQLERARADHEEAQKRFAALPFTLLPAIIATHRCADAAHRSDWQAAYDFAREVLEVDDLAWLWVWCDAGFSYPVVIETLWRAGEQETARAALYKYDAATGNNPRYRLSFQRAAATLAKLEGNLEDAMRQWRKVVSGARELSLPGELWPALMEVASLEIARGNESAAQDARREARQITQQLASAIDDEEQRSAFLAATTIV
ncbi:MAG: ATP-binding protein [Chloroflexota bacterium]